MFSLLHIGNSVKEKGTFILNFLFCIFMLHSESIKFFAFLPYPMNTSSNSVPCYHALENQDVLQRLHSTREGLSDREAEERFTTYGPNQLEEQKPLSGWRILGMQLKGFFNIVLYFACLVAGLTGRWTDAVFIGIILVINTILCFAQEYKATRAMAALKNFVEAKVFVMREGQQREIEAAALVPGDIFLLEEGMKVPADARLLEANALAVEESMLTGESVPSEKRVRKVVADADLGDRFCMVYSGTTVVRGTGLAVVTTTGMHTELGAVAQALNEAKSPPTAFEVEVNVLSKQITVLIIVLVIAAAAVMYFHHSMPITDIAIFALSLGVGAIPESMPVVLSFALAVGAQHMASRKALARKLSIVESLGSVDVICSDKTGTLTKNEMTVKAVYTVGQGVFFVTGQGYDPKSGSIKFRKPEKKEQCLGIMKAVMLCNNAKKQEAQYYGDPTEIALLVLAEKDGLEMEEVLEKNPRLEEIPFTSERQMMTTIHSVEGQKIAMCKGAPEVLLQKCTHYSAAGEVYAMGAQIREKIGSVMTHFEKDALRVLGVAARILPKEGHGGDIEENLIFLGLIGMIDPARPEASRAIKEARLAGIRTLMITGDHITTGTAIARNLGLGQNALSGREIDALSDDDLGIKVENLNVVGRATPLAKLRILKALQKNGHFASMTGDGVNDAPALKQANVGIAMGLRGTDAAKEASGLILLDDNFSTIVAAIQQGRRIFDNIRKFVNYLLTCNVGEVITVLLGALWGLQPLTAIMVLWINILTDMAPAVALGVDPENPGIMRRKPRKREEHILNGGLIWTTVFIGCKKGIENFLVFLVGYYWLGKHMQGAERLQYAQTMAFTGIVVYAFVRIAIIRSFDALKFSSNPWIAFSLILAIILQLFLIYTPDVHDFFGLHRLGWDAWGVMAVLAVWATVTGIWVSRWVESWAGHVIEPVNA